MKTVKKILIIFNILLFNFFVKAQNINDLFKESLKEQDTTTIVDILDAGFDINTKIYVPNKEVEIIESGKTNVKEEFSYRQTTFRLNYEKLFSKQNAIGFVVLNRRIKNKIPLIKFLIKKGANPDYKYEITTKKNHYQSSKLIDSKLLNRTTDNFYNYVILNHNIELFKALYQGKKIDFKLSNRAKEKGDTQTLKYIKENFTSNISNEEMKNINLREKSLNTLYKNYSQVREVSKNLNSYSDEKLIEELNKTMYSNWLTNKIIENRTVSLLEKLFSKGNYFDRYLRHCSDIRLEGDIDMSGSNIVLKKITKYERYSHLSFATKTNDKEKIKLILNETKETPYDYNYKMMGNEATKKFMTIQEFANKEKWQNKCDKKTTLASLLERIRKISSYYDYDEEVIKGIEIHSDKVFNLSDVEPLFNWFENGDKGLNKLNLEQMKKLNFLNYGYTILTITRDGSAIAFYQNNAKYYIDGKIKIGEKIAKEVFKDSIFRDNYFLTVFIKNSY